MPVSSIIVTVNILNYIFSNARDKVKHLHRAQLEPSNSAGYIIDQKLNKITTYWSCDQLRPIQVEPSSDGKHYRIIDGRHRFITYILHGFTDIPVQIHCWRSNSA